MVQRGLHTQSYLRITNRNQTRSFLSDIEIDQHEVFHTIPMLDGWFGVDSVHYTEALDGTEELDLDFNEKLVVLI